MKTRTVILPVILALILGACSVNTGSPTPEGTNESAPSASAVPTAEPRIGIEVGDTAPDVFLFPAPNGVSAMLSDFRGKVVMLNFWASWCGPCRKEMPSMERMWQDYEDKGFVIVAVSVGESPDAVRNFVDELGLTFPIYLDPSKSAYAKYNKTGGIPQTYIIDREGIIRAFIPGSRDWDTLNERAVILRLLR